VIIEPRPGGRWYEVFEDGSSCDWGHVVAWDPPGRLVLAWQLNAEWTYDSELVTEVEVQFHDNGDGTTRVEFEHRGLEAMGARAEEVRTAVSSPEGWPAILDLYAAEAAA
jgi:hypothetical protein